MGNENIFYFQNRTVNAFKNFSINRLIFLESYGQKKTIPVRARFLATAISMVTFVYENKHSWSLKVTFFKLFFKKTTTMLQPFP